MHWNTFFGASGGDEGHDVHVNGQAFYIAGRAIADFPGTADAGPVNDYSGGVDAVIMKLE